METYRIVVVGCLPTGAADLSVNNEGSWKRRWVEWIGKQTQFQPTIMTRAVRIVLDGLDA